MTDNFKSKDIQKIFGLSRQRLHQLRVAGIIEPSVYSGSQGQHNQYAFEDLLLIAVVSKLLKFGISEREIKRIAPNLKNLLAAYLGKKNKLTKLFSSNSSLNDELSWPDVTHLLFTLSDFGVWDYATLKLRTDKEKLLKADIDFINSQKEGVLLGLGNIKDEIQEKLKSV
jgi:DNA-binding transcriptional MerR regulator